MPTVEAVLIDGNDDKANPLPASSARRVRRLSALP